jgi:DNA-binding TFAR19-related protein (PDSD5 family)
MFDPQDVPPQSQDPATIAHVANRAAPIVGVIILSFGALESIMRSMLIGLRMQKSSRADRWPPDTKLSHQARERVNEWIKNVLPVAGLEAEGDRFRERFTDVKHVRDNLAHNIEAMWIDEAGKLRVLTIFDNKQYEREHQQWWANLGKRNVGRPPMPIGYAAYSDDDLIAHYDEIRALIKFVSEAQQAPGLPIPLAQQVAEQARARRTPNGPEASPK